jgi:hypothetical protein
MMQTPLRQVVSRATTSPPWLHANASRRASGKDHSWLTYAAGSWVPLGFCDLPEEA